MVTQIVKISNLILYLPEMAKPDSQSDRDLKPDSQYITVAVPRRNLFLPE